MQPSNSGPDHPEYGVIGFPTAIATAVGLIMASPVILTVTTGFGVGGGAFAAAVLIAFVMMQAQAASFAEAAAILPTTGSVYDYISCGLGRFWAITGTVSAYLLVHVFAGTAETILSGIMALVNFESLNTMLERTGSSWLVGVGLVFTFAVANAFGIRVFSRAEIVLTLGMWLTLMVFGVVGLIMPAAVPLEGWFGGSSDRNECPCSAIAGGDGDVHVRRLRVRDAAGGGTEAARARHSSRDDLGIVRCRAVHAHLR